MSKIALPRKMLGQFRTISKIINIYNVFNCNFLVVNVCDYEAASQHDLTSGKLGISSNTGHGRPPRIGNARPPRPDCIGHSRIRQSLFRFHSTEDLDC